MSEHRWVMEQHLGHPVSYTDHVHHRNGDRYDNRLENLEVIDGRLHAKMHAPQVYPLTKTCGVCGQTFTPHPTKRKRAMTCGQACGRLLSAERRRKLTAAQRGDVRTLYASGLTQTQLAASYGVAQATIWAIVSRRLMAMESA